MKNKRLKLLILDDKQEDIRAVKNIITSSELLCSIKVAGCKQLFNEQLKIFQPDLIIANYKLPGFTGLQALLSVKKIRPVIPFIFYTDPVNEQTAVKCLKAGAYDYILKSQSAKLIPAVVSSLKNNTSPDPETGKAGKRFLDFEQRIKLLFNNLILGIFQVDVKGKIKLANLAFIKMLGYNSYNEISCTYVNFTNNNEHKNIITQLKKKNYINEYTTALTQKNGNKINVKISANAVKNSAGKIIFIEGIAEDISGKKKIENALIESEERFTAMADAAPVMIWIAAADKHFFYFNKLWLQFTGSTLHDEIDDKWMRNIYAEDLNPFLNKYVSSFDSRTEFEIVFRLKRHDGKYRWILTRGIPSNFPDGNFTGYIGTAIDITDRKIVENTLKESEELYKSVVQSLMEGLIITDVSDKVLFANIRMKEITGYEIKEMVGKYNYRLFFEPDQWKVILEKNKNRFAGASERFEIKMHRKKGDEFWALINGSPYRNSKGKIIGSINTINDISNNKIAEKALQESEEKYRTVVQNVHEVIFKTDNTGTITFLNPYWLEITGHLLENSIGRYLFDFIHPDDKKRTVKEFIAIVYKRKNYCRFEFRIETSSGDYRWFLINARITVDENCNIIGTYGTLNDIHDRRLAEEELIKAKNRAEESDNLKSHFLAQISHEIRSPLNIILGYNSLIKERIEGEASLNLNNEFNIIEASGRRLLRTIDLVLNMSIIQTGSYDIVREEFDLNLLIQDMLLEFKSVAETKKIKISYSNLCRNNKVYADKYTLTQAFQNLLDNAVKFTELGGIEVFSYENDKSIFVDISDTGVGISEEYLPRLFEPFSQEEEGYSRKFEGNGLGLALTKKYIDLNQGEISVKSGKGRGTKFTIKLDRKYLPGG